MAWDVEYTDEFGAWWRSLDEDEQISVAASVELLQVKGPALRMPHSSAGNDRWYAEFVPKADKLYDEHLEELQRGHDG